MCEGRWSARSVGRRSLSGGFWEFPDAVGGAESVGVTWGHPRVEITLQFGQSYARQLVSHDEIKKKFLS